MLFECQMKDALGAKAAAVTKDPVAAADAPHASLVVVTVQA